MLQYLCKMCIRGGCKTKVDHNCIIVVTAVAQACKIMAGHLQGLQLPEPTGDMTVCSYTAVDTQTDMDTVHL